jgi:restriction system protein
MHQNSLFAVLLRSPWWVSLMVAAAAVGVAKFFIPWAYALFAGTPFFVIGVIGAWRRLREPSAARVAKTLERLRAMSWDEFAAELEAAFRRQGYEVGKPAKNRADLELLRGGDITLVSCKRWKAVRTGAEPLRELEGAGRAREARECVYVAAGEVTAQALAFAAEKRIRVLHGAELAKLLA